MADKKVFIKTEANDRVGGGHLFRSIALAFELKKFDIQTEFIFSETSQNFIEKTKRNFNVNIIKKYKKYNAEEYLKFIESNSLILFDTDDYNFYSGEIIDKLSANNIKTACFTITDKYPISTDILINSNIIALKQNFNTPEYTKKLLGPQYLILRPEFSQINYDRNLDSKNLLIFFGNADINCYTELFLENLKKNHQFFSEINIIVGALNKCKDKIRRIVLNCGKMKIYENLQAYEMIDLYKNTGYAITSAGMTMWEMALFEIPQIVLASSDREKVYTDYLAELNFIYVLKNINKKSDKKILDFDFNEIVNSSEFSSLRLKDFKKSVNPKGITKIAENFVAILK